MATIKRRNSGAALLTILVIGICSIVFMLALASIVTQSVRATSANKWSEEIRNAAEIGIDYAINKYNSTYPCLLEPEPDKLEKVTPLPPEELEAGIVNGVTPTTGIPNLTISVKVIKIATPLQWGWLEANSAIYSRQRDPNKSVSAGWQTPPSSNLRAGSSGGYRVIESTASNDIITKTVRVVLEAQFTPPPGETGPGETIKNELSYFDKPLFSNTTLSLNPPADGSLNVYDSRGTSAREGNSYPITLTTNQLVDIAGNTTIFGNVNVSSIGSTSSQKVALLDSSSTIKGTLTTNGEYQSGLEPRAVTESEGPDPPRNSPRDNVRADAELVNDVGMRTGRNTNPAMNNGSLSQNQVAPIQQPSTSQTLGSLASSAGETLAGDYKTNGLIATSQVEDSLPIPPLSIDTAARLFVQDATASADAVRIQSKAFNPPTDPRALQIWYEGTKPVIIDVAAVPFNGLIYAPNAPVSITGTGTFTGAVIGQSVSISLSGDLKIVSDLNNVNQKTDKGKENRQYGLNYNLGEDGSIVYGWKPVSWSEFKRSK